MLGIPKALSTIFFFWISKNLKDIWMGNQQGTRVIYIKKIDLK
jgi:hypothetical protein